MAGSRGPTAERFWAHEGAARLPKACGKECTTDTDQERAGLAWQMEVWNRITDIYLHEIDRRFAPVGPHGAPWRVSRRPTSLPNASKRRRLQSWPLCICMVTVHTTFGTPPSSSWAGLHDVRCAVRRLRGRERRGCIGVPSMEDDQEERW
jgi:hypothetical protein